MFRKYLLQTLEGIVFLMNQFHSQKKIIYRLFFQVLKKEGFKELEIRINYLALSGQGLIHATNIK